VPQTCPPRQHPEAVITLAQAGRRYRLSYSPASLPAWLASVCGCLGPFSDERPQSMHRVHRSLVPESPQGLLDGRAGQSGLLDEPMFGGDRLPGRVLASGDPFPDQVGKLPPLGNISGEHPSTVLDLRRYVIPALECTRVNSSHDHRAGDDCPTGSRLPGLADLGRSPGGRPVSVVRPPVGRRKGSDQHRQSRPATRVPQRTRLNAERLRNRRTRIPSLLIRRLCRAYQQPGHLVAGLPG
jgi:hypothetical protein